MLAFVVNLLQVNQECGQYSNHRKMLILAPHKCQLKYPFKRECFHDSLLDIVLTQCQNDAPFCGLYWTSP